MDQRGLVEGARKGEHDAFASLIDAHLARLDAAARLILRDGEPARDAVQEALIRAWRDLPGLRDPRSVRCLAASIARPSMSRSHPAPERTVDRGRAQSDRRTGDSATSQGSLADRAVLDEALASLASGNRAVVALHYLLGMPSTCSVILGSRLDAADRPMPQFLVGPSTGKIRSALWTATGYPALQRREP